MNKIEAFEEHKKQTGYKDLSAVSAISAFGAGFDARDKEIVELKKLLLEFYECKLEPDKLYLLADNIKKKLEKYK